MEATAIVTMPPYAPYMRDALSHPVVSGIRLNTVMPVKSSDSLEDVLKRLLHEAGTFGKELWIDLKCRQIRVVGYAVPPFTEIGISHRITVEPNVRAYFHDGQESTVLLSADGNRLIMQDGPKRVVGPGESINIPHQSLSIEGYLTDTDKRYVEAAIKAGVHNYMLSFVEKPDDVADLRALDSAANVVEKIESVKGMDYVKTLWKPEGKTRLMAARGDLYTELKMPHQVIAACELIVAKDPGAIVASRIFPSLAESLEPSCQDIGDVDNLLRMGYRAFMLGDDVCMARNSLVSALNLFAAVAERYGK